MVVFPELMMKYSLPNLKVSYGRRLTVSGSKGRKESTMKANHRLNLMLIASAALGVAAVTGLKAQVKPPVYVVIDISEISDAAAFSKAVAALPPNDVASVGGREIIRTTKPVAIDGSAPPNRLVVLQFDNAAQVKPGRICLQPSKLARFV